MPKIIGPSFAAEITTAGLAGLPFAWTESGITYGDAMTPSQVDAVEAVLAHHDPDTAAPARVPDISDRQFAQVLAMRGLISQEAALEWVKIGTVPEPIQSVVDAIPDETTRFSAQMLLSGATTFERNHPMTGALASGLGMTSAQVDSLWQQGAAL